MFSFFRKKKKKESEEAAQDVLREDRPQKADNGLYRGMYCPVCGYMEVNPDSSALPLEGFALCANCGAPLKRGWFLMDSTGGFSLAGNAGRIAETKRRTVSGGHYRVRPRGPYRGRIHGRFTSF